MHQILFSGGVHAGHKVSAGDSRTMQILYSAPWILWPFKHFFGLCKLRDSKQPLYGAIYNSCHDLPAKESNKRKKNASNPQCMQVPPLCPSILYARLQRILHLCLVQEIRDILEVERGLFPQATFVLDDDLPKHLA